jgi:hypothetical protein
MSQQLGEAQWSAFALPASMPRRRWWPQGSGLP